MSMSFFSELKRRQVLRTAAAYVAAAWLLVQVADTVFEAFELGEEAVRLVIIVLALGFVPVIILSWVFQLTPEGLRRDSGDSAADAPAGHRADRIIIVLLAAGVTFFAFDKFVLDPQRDEEIAEQARTEAFVESYGDKSIAVLAFENLSADADNEYFSDGIAEEMINLLARIPELRVISRSSAFTYKGKDLSVPEIAEELNVTYVLEGSVRKAGDRIRVTAQLIDARTDTHLYSENFDRTIDDIFAIQDEVSSNVVENLRVHLTGEMPRARPADPEAHALLLRARYLIGRNNSHNYDVIEELLLESLEIDPDYLDAILTLANMYSVFGRERHRPIEEARVAVRDLVDRALAIDPDNGYAIVLSAWPEGSKGDLHLIIRRLQEGLAKDSSNLGSINWAAEVLRLIGDFKQSNELLQHMLARDPLCNICYYRKATNFLALGDYADAEAAIRRFKQTADGGGHTLGLALFMQGKYEESAAAFSNLNPDNNNEATLLHAQAMSGIALDNPERVQTALEALRENYSTTAPDFIASIFALTGDFDSAFAALEPVAAMHPRFSAEIWPWPLLNNLHDDPRWTEFREKIGHSEETIEALQFNVVLQ